MFMKATISLQHTVKPIPDELDLKHTREGFFSVSYLIEVFQIILPPKPQSGWSFVTDYHFLPALCSRCSKVKKGFLSLPPLCLSCSFYFLFCTFRYCRCRVLGPGQFWRGAGESRAQSRSDKHGRGSEDSDRHHRLQQLWRFPQTELWDAGRELQPR